MLHQSVTMMLASERNNLLHLVAKGSPACRAAQWSTAIAPNGCPADGST